MVEEVERRFPEVEAVTVEEVGRLLETGSVVFVDARAEREREISWIPGAITSEEFEQDPDRYADRTIVAYCTIGHRSSEYAKRQNEEGRRVLNLRGSLLSWAHAGAPLVGPMGRRTASTCTERPGTSPPPATRRSGSGLISAAHRTRRLSEKGVNHWVGSRGLSWLPPPSLSPSSTVLLRPDFASSLIREVGS